MTFLRRGSADAEDDHAHREQAGQVQARAMTPGDITITPVGPPTRWRQAGQSLVLLIRLAPACIRAIAGDECAIDPDRFEIREVFSARDLQIEDLGNRLLTALELEGANSDLYVDTLACELTIESLRDYTIVPASPSRARAKLSPHKLARAVHFIDENLRNELTLAEIAEAVAPSPGHFAHAFRQATGVAPHRYVLERRVERAKTLLRDSDMPITEIADRVGCSSPQPLFGAFPPDHRTYAPTVPHAGLTHVRVRGGIARPIRRELLHVRAASMVCKASSSGIARIQKFSQESESVPNFQRLHSTFGNPGQYAS
jgi:AraC family transcriptional regulator